MLVLLPWVVGFTGMVGTAAFGIWLERRGVGDGWLVVIIVLCGVAVIGLTLLARHYAKHSDGEGVAAQPMVIAEYDLQDVWNKQDRESRQIILRNIGNRDATKLRISPFVVDSDLGDEITCEFFDPIPDIRAGKEIQVTPMIFVRKPDGARLVEMPSFAEALCGAGIVSINQVRSRTWPLRIEYQDLFRGGYFSHCNIRLEVAGTVKRLWIDASSATHGKYS